METTLFGAKYRIKAARIPNWNYASPGRYYVTICTWGHVACWGAASRGDSEKNGIATAIISAMNLKYCD